MSYVEELRERIADRQLRESLDKIREAMESIWNPEAPRVIQAYTDHGSKHCERLAEYATRLLEANRGRALSDQETYLLLSGIYLHDIGMQCDVVRFQDIKWGAERLGANFNVHFNARAANEYTYDEQKAIRKNHQYLSAAWIEYAYRTHTSALGLAAQTIPRSLMADLMDVCKYHSQLKITDCPTKFTHDTTQRKQLVAALLRFSDELDIAATRVNIQTALNFSIDPRNAVYWWLHDRTRVDFVASNAIKLTVILHPDDAQQHGFRIKSTFIDDFYTKNSSVLQVLVDNDIPVLISFDSGVVGDKFFDQLPQDIVQALEAITPGAIEKANFMPDFRNLTPATNTATNIGSLVPSLFKEIEEASPMAYIVVDLGEGREWLTSRLYLFALLLEKLRDLRCIVFVGATPDGPKRYIGIAEPQYVIETLSLCYPLLGQAYYNAYAHTVPRPVPKVLDSHLAQSVILSYLNEIRIQQDDDPSDDLDKFVRVGYQGEPTTWEYAEWLNVDSIEEMMAGSLTKSRINKADLQTETPIGLAQVLRTEGNYVAVIEQDGRVDTVIDRREIAENVARSMIQDVLP